MHKLLKQTFLALAIVPAMAFAGPQAPTTVSPMMQKIINADNKIWNICPKSASEWQDFINVMYDSGVKGAKAVLDKYPNVVLNETKIAGVNCYELTNNKIKSNGKTLLCIHGGGYVFGQGLSGLVEAIYMAGLSGYKVIAVDYRMAPKYPYPAAVDDVYNVYKELLKNTDAKNIGVYGTSTGGGLTLILTQKAKDTNLPLPAAIAALTPWSDMDKIGDSYITNEHVDNSLVAYDGWLKSAAQVYAQNHNLKDPYLSPVYGDTTGFPPTLLVSGTRDLFLSNTVRMQENLLKHNVNTDLIVYEGQSHAQYYFGLNSDETLFHFDNLIKFFNQHLITK